MKCALVDSKKEVMQNLLLLHRHNMMIMVLVHGLLVNASSTWSNCIAFCFLSTTSRGLHIGGNLHALSWDSSLNAGRVNLETWMNCGLLSATWWSRLELLKLLNSSLVICFQLIIGLPLSSQYCPKLDCCSCNWFTKYRECHQLWGNEEPSFQLDSGRGHL